MGDAKAARDGIRQFEIRTGVDVVVHGDESRFELARRVVDHCEAISAQAVQLLERFLRDRGEFDLSSIDVFDMKTTEAGDFSLRYTFMADRDPHEYNYTYFEVYFLCHEPPQQPFWPHKFTVGFH